MDFGRKRISKDDVNTDYSVMEYNIAGTAGVPELIISSGYVSDSDKASVSITKAISILYPIAVV
jgi:hypothetical protein